MSSPNQDDLTLDDLLEKFSQAMGDNPYEEFFLLSNPFPTLEQFCDFCVNQESVQGKFTQALRDFYRDSRLRIITIIGSPGAGKTHLLRYLEQTIKQWRQPRPNTEQRSITDLFTIFVQHPQRGYLEIHRQIISQLGAMFFAEFFIAVKHGKINLLNLPDELSRISPELIQAFIHIAQMHSAQTSFLPESQSYRILEYWLQGVKLATTDKKQLGNVTAEVGRSSTVAIKFLSDLVKIFLHVKLFKGLIIFIDEFEEVLSGLSPTSQAQYAQDLRNLFDSNPRGIMFVVATTPTSDRFRRISPALHRRLGSGVDIDPIAGEVAALEYAKAYIEWGRNEFTKEMKRDVCLPKDCPDVDRPYYPLSEAKVKNAYNRLKENYGIEAVIPGDLLPELHHLLYQRVYGEG